MTFKRHRKAVDHMLLAMAAASSGKTVEAAQQIAEAIKCQDFQVAMGELDNLNEDAFNGESDPSETEFPLEGDDNDEDSLDVELSRLLASTDDEEEESDDDEAEEESDDEDDSEVAPVVKKGTNTVKDSKDCPDTSKKEESAASVVKAIKSKVSVGSSSRTSTGSYMLPVTASFVSAVNGLKSLYGKPTSFNRETSSAKWSLATSSITLATSSANELRIRITPKATTTASTPSRREINLRALKRLG